MDSKEIQPVNPKGNQSGIFIGRTDVEGETPIFGLLMQRADSFEKTLMLGKIEDRRKRGLTEDEMLRWHHQFNGHELGQILGDGKGKKVWHVAVCGVTKSQTRPGN